MTYADDFNLRSPIANMYDVANAVDGLLITNTNDSTSSTINTTSTSYVAYTNISMSVTVADGEKVLLLASASVSNSTAGQWVAFQINRDASGIGPEKLYTDNLGSTTGQDGELDIHYIDNPGAGTYTYTLYWKVSANTGYSAQAQLDAIVFQNT